MRNKKWLKIWENKGSSQSEHQHVLDGWDLNTEPEYQEIAYSCLVDNENLLSQSNLKAVEFGCGSGAFISALSTKFPNLEIEGVDYSKNLIEIAKQKNSSNTFNVLDINEPLTDWEKTLSRKTYDVIFSFGVFLYLNSTEEVLDVLEKMLSILNGKGLIILGEINALELEKDSLDMRDIDLQNREEITSEETPTQLYIPKKLFKDFRRYISSS